MYFTKVELHNFGIYKGTHEMSLTDQIGNRNITLVGGLNGRGKTTFHDSILIALYGKQALKYIQENFNQDLSYEKLQKLFSYHKNTLNHFLKRTTGMSLTNYVIELRMKYACELLSYSTLSILEISQKCGYHYESFFSRQFKERFGVSPNEFRARMTIKTK